MKHSPFTVSQILQGTGGKHTQNLYQACYQHDMLRLKCDCVAAGGTHLYLCCHCASYPGCYLQVLDLQGSQQEEPCSCCHAEEHGQTLGCADIDESCIGQTVDRLFTSASNEYVQSWFNNDLMLHF